MEICNIVVDIVYYLKKLLMTPRLTEQCYQLSKPEIEFDAMEKCARNYASAHVQKRQLFRQRRLNHSGVGGGTAFRRVYPARA